MGVGPISAQLRAGVMRVTGDRNERSFITPQYAVVYLPETGATYRDERGRSYRAEPGSFFQRFPSTRHSVHFEGSGIRCYIAVPCQVFELLSLMGLADPARPVIRVGSDQSLVDRFEQIRDTLAVRNERDLVDSLSEMTAFLIDLHRMGRDQRVDSTTEKPIARAMQMLNENLEERVKMPEIAREVGMGYSTFRKKFVEHVGTSPNEYRIRRRMERAMAMLVQEQSLVKEVAGRLGYPDEYAFSAQFKRFVGMSPRTFRIRGT